jgi:ribonuclease HI
MSSDAEKAELLERLAKRDGLSDEECSVLREAAGRFRAPRPAPDEGTSPSTRVERVTQNAGSGRKSRSQRRERRMLEPPSASLPVDDEASAILWTDGAARGNPGPAGAGAILKSASGRVLAECSKRLGHATNNVAEYEAVLLGLQRALELGIRKLEIRADSELLIKQLRGEYRVRHAGLKPLYEAAKRLLDRFEATRLVHVRREYNSEADRLANLGIDAHDVSNVGEGREN